MADMEDVLDTVRDHLASDDFYDKLVEVYTRHGDAVGVIRPEVMEAVLASHDIFPYIELAANMERSMRNDSIVMDLLNEVFIYWHERHDDERYLQRRVIRAMRAVREYFEEHSVLHPVASVGYIGDASYSPFVPADVYDGRPFLKSGLIQLYLRTFS